MIHRDDCQRGNQEKQTDEFTKKLEERAYNARTAIRMVMMSDEPRCAVPSCLIPATHHLADRSYCWHHYHVYADLHDLMEEDDSDDQTRLNEDANGYDA